MRLSRKIMLMTSGIVAVLSLLTIVTINDVVKSAVHDAIEQYGIALAKTTSNNVANQYLDGKLLTVKSALANQLDSDHYLVYAYILNRDDGTVLDTFERGFPGGLIQANPLPDGRASVSKLLNINGDLVIDAGVPLVKGLNSIELHIGLKETALLVPLSKIPWVILLMTIVGVIIGSLAALLLSRLITGSLNRLTRQAELIGEGDLESEITIDSQDEVGNLARSFNRMTAQLRETILALQRRNQELSLLSQQLGEREELLERLWHKVISAQEEERKRIARELHDETTQSLAAITIGLKTAEEIMPIDQREGMHFLQQVRDMAGQVVKELHNIVYDLRPTILDDLGLVPALRWYAETRLGARGLEFELQVSGIDGRFPAEIETTLFRIGQEAISNTFKHSRARKVVLVLTQEGNNLTMQIKDNGQGFASEEMWSTSDERAHLGLLGMRERAALCGGVIEINSHVGEGTDVTVKLKLFQKRASKGG